MRTFHHPSSRVCLLLFLYPITHPFLTAFLTLIIQMPSNFFCLNIVFSLIIPFSLSIYDMGFHWGTCPPSCRPLFYLTIHLLRSIPRLLRTTYARRSYPVGCQGLFPERRLSLFCGARFNHLRSSCLFKPNSVAFPTKSESASIYLKQQRPIPLSILTSIRKTSPHDSIWLQKLQIW